MILLVLDSALGACTAAVFDDGEVLSERSEPMARGQAESLVPMMRDVLRESGVVPDAVAVTVGPGAFTGIRIGLAAARGYALARNLPIIGVSTTDAIAEAQPDSNGNIPLLVALDSRRGDLFVERYPPGTGPRAVTPAALPDIAGGTVRLAGDGAPYAAAALTEAGIEAHHAGGPDLPTAQAIADVAMAKTTREGLPSQPPGPVYIRPPDVSPPDRDRARRPDSRTARNGRPEPETP